MCTHVRTSVACCGWSGETKKRLAHAAVSKVFMFRRCVRSHSLTAVAGVVVRVFGRDSTQGWPNLSPIKSVLPANTCQQPTNRRQGNDVRVGLERLTK